MVCQKILCKNKREYGDGLDKFEPNDINNAAILDFRVIDNSEIIVIEQIYNKIKQYDIKEEYITQLENIFKKYVL